jgi:hypothetical protein
MTVYYYTKYWESTGITIIETSEEPDDLSIVYIRGDICGGTASYCIHVNKDAFRSIEAARGDVVKRRKKAIKAAEKKLAKLNAIDPHTMIVHK